MMNNSYENNIYSGQIGEITELQAQVEQHPHQLNNHHQHQQEYLGTHNSVDGLKGGFNQERESIIANNTHAQQQNHEQVAYQEQVQPAAMDNSENANNHDGDGEMEVLEEHIETEPQPASGEEPVDDAKPDSEDQTELKEEDMQVEKLEDNEDEKVEEEAEGKEDPNEVDQKDVKTEPQADGERQTKTRRRDGEPADLEICRTCQSKESLSSIFEFDDVIRICDMIIKLCPTIRITERDHLPHKICKSCVEKVKIANEFKALCENTDKELRQSLKRSYNKTRRTTDFVIVNCPMSDEEDNDEEPQDDDEYKVSQSEVESEPVTSDDSFEPSNKRLKKTPKRRGRKPRSESSGPTPGTATRRGRGRRPGYSPVAVVTTPRRGPGRPPGRGPGRPPKSASKSPGLANVVYIEAPEASSSDSDDDKPIRGRRSTKSHDCTKCDETFKTGVELKEHLLTHKGDLFPCTKCDKSFKSKVYLANHLERHDQDDKRREEKIKAKELKKQQQRQKEIQKRRDHEDRVKRQKDSGSAEKKKKPEPSPANSGRDLFKCVAPLTSTYWSDSFSD